MKGEKLRGGRWQAYVVSAALVLCGGMYAVEPFAATFAESKTLALQIALDRRGFSCNAIDGQWGRKSQVALATYCAVHGYAVPPTPEIAHDILFPRERNLFRVETVTQREHDALVRIPFTPEGKASLKTMGYETIMEMYAERGHLTEGALRRLNPDVAWPNPPVGTRVKIPDFLYGQDIRLRASVLRVTLSRFEVTVFDEKGRLIALFPCSIAADKAKLPSEGELQVTTIIPHPDYTYTPDRVAKGGRIVRRIFPPGPNNPVGSSWMGLTLPGYGIHGTPKPETIGCAESHGCFRLANWNAVRLRKMCETGTSVVVEK
ncbi:MAG: L,D-transpeptidase [Kiritimatiellae bacterium]|nr:L,D-transpeptidase [Kiritimatiellia bacterium]